MIGLVRSRAGWDLVLALSAAGFLAASTLMIGLRTHATTGAESHGSVAAEIREGFRAVGADPLLAQLMLMAVLGYAMTGPLQIMLPKLAREVLHLSELQRGAYLGLLALALILGGVSALALARRVHHGQVMFVGIVAGSLVFAALGQVTQAPVSAIGLACIGVAGGMVISLAVAAMALAGAALAGIVALAAWRMRRLRNFSGH